MSRTDHARPKLPAALLDTLGPGTSLGTSRSRSFKNSKPAGRKEQRKAFRVEKKQHQRQSHRSTLPAKSLPDIAQPASKDVSKQRARARPSSESHGDSSDESEKNPKITKPKVAPKSGAAPRSEPEPKAPAKPKVSRAVRAKLDEDDAEIAALERKLGMRRKKSKGSSGDDFADLLGDIDDVDDMLEGKRKRSEYDDYLASKRRHVRESADAISVGSIEDESSGSDEDVSEDETEDDRDSEEDDFEGFSEDETNSEDAENLKLDDYDEDNALDKLNYDEEISRPAAQRENPYVAPVIANAAAVGKYVPPSMRHQATTGDEEIKLLRRQLRGLINRLSEANILSILRDVEKAYANNPRQHVTTVLIDLFMELLCDRSALMDTFIILHAAFAAAIYKVLGAHFGAQLLERIVKDFDQIYNAEKISPTGTKEITNLVALLAELYTFQLVGSNVIFDYIKIFLADLSELNTELLLKVVKNCGSQLRHDDPTSLKDIVILLQKSVGKVGEVNLPVRTKFMIETINDLKNNKQKAGVAASVVVAEHTTRLKKALGTLPNAKATEPLGVSLADIKSSSKQGKWWLVGASWKNEAQQTSNGPIQTHPKKNDDMDQDDDEDVMANEDEGVDLMTLAKQQRMNNDIRRAIFMNIMSAQDFKDAYARLTKLKLKKAQELEIPRVLIHCAGGEQSYNPYYTLIAKELCAEHRFKWAMQHSLWDLFKRMGERSDVAEDDADMDIDEDDTVDLKRIVNLGRMYGQMIADGAFPLTSLKVLNFAYLQAKTKSFLEVMLSTVFKQFSKRSKSDDGNAGTLESAITALLMRTKETPQVVTGLQYFLLKEANFEEITSSSSERKTLKKASRVASLVLTQLSSSLS